MTIGPAAKPRGVGPEQGSPADDQDMTAGEADVELSEPDTRTTAAAAVLVLLVALVVQTVIVVRRIRSGRKDRTSRAASHSTIRFAAAPYSTVHVVAAPSFGRSHLQLPARLSSRSGVGRARPRGLRRSGRKAPAAQQRRAWQRSACRTCGRRP